MNRTQTRNSDPADDAFDVALCIEVLYTSPDVQADIERLFRVVRPGGLLMITHRPKFYYIGHCLAEGNLEDAVLVATKARGRLKKGHHRIHYNWQTRCEIESLYGQLGGTLLATYPIGASAVSRVTRCPPSVIPARWTIDSKPRCAKSKPASKMSC